MCEMFHFTATPAFISSTFRGQAWVRFDRRLTFGPRRHRGVQRQATGQFQSVSLTVNSNALVITV